MLALHNHPGANQKIPAVLGRIKAVQQVLSVSVLL